MPESPDPGGPPERFVSPVSDDDLQRERARARALRASAWWKRRLQAGRCGYCEAPTPPRALTMDHRVPLVRGGRSIKANLVPACRACNAAKKHWLPTEWDAYQAGLGKKSWTGDGDRS
jgi:5-methylcytosine-specific restriction endonuclease McrA